MSWLLARRDARCQLPRNRSVGRPCLPGRIAWAALFVQRKHGDLILILLSITMLPVGGDIIPALIGIIASAVGTRINTPLTWWRRPLSGNWLRFWAKLWPWPLIAFFVWIPAQWILGHFFNEFMLKQGFLFMLFEFGLLLLSVVSGFAYDIQKATASRQADSVE